MKLYIRTMILPLLASLRPLNQRESSGRSTVMSATVKHGWLISLFACIAIETLLQSPAQAESLSLKGFSSSFTSDNFARPLAFLAGVALTLLGVYLTRIQMLPHPVIADPSDSLLEKSTRQGLLTNDDMEALIQSRTQALQAANQSLNDANEQLKEKELLFSLCKDIICIIRPNGRYAEVNPAFEAILGYSPAEMVQQSYMDFIHPEDLDRTRKEAERFKETQSCETFESRYRCKNGSYKWLLWTACLDLEGGNILAVGHDYHDRRQTEESLKQALRRLQAAEGQRNLFLSALSHDLRTPLVAQHRILELLEEDMNGKASETATLVMAMIGNNQNLLNMVASVLETFRYESGEMEIDYESVNFSLIVLESLRDVAQLIADKDIQIENHVDTVPERLYADRSQIRRVVQNLLGNAIHHVPKGGRICLSAAFTTDGLEFRITDNGPGIDPKVRPYLFERFFLGSRHQKIGSGFGLFICRLIVEMHQGKIWEEDNPDKPGAHFIMTLPSAAKLQTLQAQNPIHEEETFHVR